MDQDIIHWHIICPQMLGTVDQLDLGKMLAHALYHWQRIGVYNDLIDLRDSQQRFEDVMEQWLSSQEAIILARHTLAVVTHRDKGGKFKFRLHGRIKLTSDWAEWIPRNKYFDFLS